MPGWGLTVLLAEAIGHRRAREMSVTGNFVDAPHRARRGASSTTSCPHDELLAVLPAARRRHRVERPARRPQRARDVPRGGARRRLRHAAHRAPTIAAWLESASGVADEVARRQRRDHGAWPRRSRAERWPSRRSASRSPTPSSTTCAPPSVRTRWPDQVEDAGWDYGAELGFVQELVAYWADGFDWRAREQVLNSAAAVPHRGRRARVRALRAALRAPAGRRTGATAARPHPRLAEHPLRVPRRRRAPREPGCVRRRSRRRVPRRRAVTAGVRLLRHPASTRHDAARDGDDVRRVDARARLRPLRGRRVRLGRVRDRAPRPRPPRRGRRASTWGCSTSAAPGTYEPTADDADYSARAKAWRRDESGYSRSRAPSRSRSRTGSWTHRPASRRGSSRSGDAGPTARATSNVCSRATSCSRPSPSTGSPARSTAPTACTTRAATIRSGSPTANGCSRRRGSCSSAWSRAPTPNIGPPPRSRADAVYDVRRWTVADRGLHFPAIENPDLYVEELRTFFRPLR